MRASGHRRAEALGSLYKARLRGLLHHEWAVSLKLLQRAYNILRVCAQVIAISCRCSQDVRRQRATARIKQGAMHMVSQTARVGGLRSVSRGLQPAGGCRHRTRRWAEALGSLYKARLRGLLHHEWAASLKLLQRAYNI